MGSVEYQLERKILSNILAYSDYRKIALDNIKHIYFADNEISIIYESILKICNEKGNDKITENEIIESLNKKGFKFSTISGYMGDSMFFYDEKEDSVRMLIGNFIRRKLNEQVQSGTKNLLEIQKEINEIVGNVSLGGSETTIFNGKEIMSNGIKRIQERAKKTGLSGIDTGYKNLNNLFDGWQRGNLVILAGRPSMGKTAFALQQFVRSAKLGSSNIFFSLEMPEKELTNRIISAETGIKLENIKKGHLSSNEWDLLFKNTAKIHDLGNKLLIDDRSGLTLEQIRAKVIERKKSGLDMIFIDYLTIMGVSNRYKDNRVLQIGEITIGLKNLAKEQDICVVLLAQLSRSVETRVGSKMPYLSDLRDSGSIEQDADVIGFCYRPEYYGIEVDENGNSTKGLFQYLVKKNRNGSLEAIDFDCDLSTQRIFEQEENSFNDYVYPTMKPNENIF